MRRVLWAVAFLMVMVAQVSSAQVWDRSGNGQLSGAYVFRNVIYVPADASGTIGRAISAFGTITFNGSGSYTLSGTGVDSSAGSGSYTSSGTYSLGLNGYGFMTHPYASGGTYNVNITLANGVLMGSSTEAFINDLFFAVPASSATNATFNGSYSLAYLNVAGTYTNTFNTMATLNPNGSGNIGSVPVKSYIGSSPTAINQTENSVTYSFSSGVGTLRFPTSPANLPLLGNKQMYISPDGSFVFGGSTTGFDIFVGVKRDSGTPPSMSDMYYSVGMEHTPAYFDSFFGSYFAYAPLGAIWEHQRVLESDLSSPFNYTAAGVMPFSPTADYTDPNSLIEYVVGQGAKFRVGIGQSPYMTLRVGVKINEPTNPGGSAPWIKSTRVQNSASSAPFTAGVSPGELVTIYGENFATSPVIMQGGIPFPTTLNSVQVLINNQPAPLFYVFPGQIAFIMPYGTTTSIVQIQVMRNNVPSNAITMFNYSTGPGLFTESTQGQGLAKILHADYSQVTPDSPATPGETLQVFLTGLGQVFPTIQDGGLGQVSDTVLDVKARIDNLDAPVYYKGLAPGLAGLYQLNIQVPNGVGNGDDYVDIITPDGYTTQATIPIVGGAVPPRGAKAVVRRR